MEISALGFLIASCFLLLACSWVFHLDHVCVSRWKLLSRALIGGCSAPLPLPPGSFGLPWLGESLQFTHALRAGDLQRFLLRRTARFGSKTFKTHIFLRPTVIVQGAAANRFLAASENQHLLVNSWAASSLSVVGQHAPSAKRGPAHRRLRHIMNSCLGPAALQKLVGKADLLTQRHFASCWKGKSELTLVPLIKMHTFRIACSLLASIEEEAVVVRLYPLFKPWLDGMVALPLDLPGTAFRKALNAREVLVGEVGDIIHRRQQELAHAGQSSSSSNEGSSGKEDMLSMLLRAQDENGSSLNHEELQDVLLFMLFAGHDTTSATLVFALKFLEQNPVCLRRLIQEHDVIASKRIEGKELKWTDVQEMKYTWRVIQETLRLVPPIFGGLKEATQELNYDGYRIPKGWKMLFTMAGTHNDEQYFSEASKFDPSRFDTKMRQEKFALQPFSYVPFGIGPHSCPGNDFARMTTSLYLHHLVQNSFTWTSIEPNEKVSLSPMPTLTNGYPIKLT